jgi:hypothetical protein
MTIEEFNEKYLNKYEIELLDFGAEFIPFYLVKDLFTYVRTSHILTYYPKYNCYNLSPTEHTPPQLLSDILLVFDCMNKAMEQK